MSAILLGNGSSDWLTELFLFLEEVEVGGAPGSVDTGSVAFFVVLRVDFLVCGRGVVVLF